MACVVMTRLGTTGIFTANIMDIIAVKIYGSFVSREFS